MTDPALKLLLVDDEDSVREPLSRFLQADPYHYEVTDVPNFEEAVKLIEDKKGYFDVALIDEVLGDGSSGLEILKYIKSAYSDIEVILFTGWGLKSGEEVRQIGAYSYIAKPFDADQLALTIYNAAERRRIRREHNYMEALVRASQELAQTTQMDKQLNLAWEFVSGQLDVSSFFIALYASTVDRIYFPLAFDKGRQVNLPDVTLGEDSGTWGLAGYVVKTGEEALWSTLEEKEQICVDRKIIPRVEGESSASCFCIPLIIGGRVRGVLSAQSYRPHVFSSSLQNALRALAGHLSIALENSRLFAEINQKVKDNEHQSQRIAALEKLAININSNLELEEILTKTCQAAADFFHADHSGLVIFDKDYVHGVVEAEYPNLGARGKIIPLRGVPLEEQMIESQKPLVIPDVREEKVLGAVQDIMLNMGIQSSLFVPVVGKSGLLGSFSLDSTQQKRQFTKEDIELCQIFASQVAVAIENARLYQEVQDSRDYLHSLFKASSEVISPRDPNDVLQSIVDQACQSTGAWRAVILLVDEGGYPQVLASSGFDHHLEAATNIRESGISRQVMTSGEPRFIEDVEAGAQAVHPEMLAQGVKAAACLPLLRWGKSIGILWIHYREEHSFSDAEWQALQIYANQSAVAYDNARHIRELEQLREATESMASVEEPKQVLQKVVESAKQVLGADLALIWSYDANRDVFIPEELVAEGIPEEQLEKFRRQEPKAGRTTRYVLEKGYLKVIDVTKSPDIGNPTRTFLKSLGVKSFQSIRLDVAGEPLGILHVDHKILRDFGKEEHRILEHFANHAALTLKKARLLTQVKRAREAARVITEVATLGKLDNTLQEIVQGAKEVLGCEIVTLYTFDEKTQRFTQAEGVGFKRKGHLRPPHELPRDSALWRVVELSEPYYHVAENAPEDRLLQGGFVRSEKVHSALGIQLRFERERVGVMFINYQTLHRFTQEEINDALQFGYQAAVVIRNAQSHDEALKRATALSGLYEAGQTIISTLSLEETLARIAEQALRIIGTSFKPKGCFSHIALQEGHALRFVAAYPKKMLTLLQKTVEIDLSTSLKIGIVGRAAKEGRSLYVSDVSKDTDYIKASELTNSQVSIPLKIGEQIIGVLSIENPLPAAFSLEDMQNVELLASQASIGIENARKVEHIENMRLAAENMASATSVQEMLERIVISAKNVMNADRIAIWQYDNLRESFVEDGLVISDNLENSGIHTNWQIPQPGGIGYNILEQGIISIENIEDDNIPYLREENRKFLSRGGVKSFLGVSLKVGDENLGVLYVDFNKYHIFSNEELRSAMTFSNHAALALKNVKFLERQSRVRNAFRVIANLTTLGNLKKTLGQIAEGAMEVFGCDTVTLYTYDQDRRQFGFPPTLKGARLPQKVYEIGEVLKDSVVARILERDDLYKSEDAQNDDILGGAFVKREGIKSSLGIPLVASGRKVGVMFVSFRSSYRFVEEVLTDIRLFADQAAIAIRNEQLHDETQNRAKALEGLYEAGKVITSTMSLDETLGRIAEAALRIISSDYNYKEGIFSHIALLEQNKLYYVAAYPNYILEILREDVETDLATGSRIGISGRAAKTKKPLIVPNVLRDPDYISIADHTRSQLSIPLRIEDKIIGVLSIEHPKLDAFTVDDLKNIESLAAQAAMAIQNVQRYEELQKTYQAVQETKEALAARTALAWTGMVSSTWRHAITRDTVTIRDQIKLLRGDLSNQSKSSAINKRLEMIERLSNRILEKPITAPLSAEEGTVSVSLNKLIQERVNSLWLHELYKPVKLDLDFALEDFATVRASPEWLQRVLDILIDNAIDASQEKNESHLTISTRHHGNHAEILIKDNGHGIPAEVWERLFREPIRKTQGEKGQGMGLLFAQTIIQTYGGKIRVIETSPMGTTMGVSLPLED
jgi:GAF domain-containing protein